MEWVLAAQIAVTLPRFLRSCAGLDGTRWIVYLVHHAFDVFLFWGPLFFWRSSRILQAHLALALVTVLHWLTNRNRCVVTVELNRMCGYPEDDWFDSIKNRLGLERFLGDGFHFYWIAALVLYDLLILFASR